MPRSPPLPSFYWDFGLFNEAYRRSNTHYVETFHSKDLKNIFELILDAWTNEGFGPFAAPEETGEPFGARHGNNTRAVKRQRVTARPHGWTSRRYARAHRRQRIPDQPPADIRHRGFSPKRSMPIVWENNNDGLPAMHASGVLKPYPVEFRRRAFAKQYRFSCRIFPVTVILRTGIVLSSGIPGNNLSPRERTILHSIVRAYIDNGEPVGSRTISRMRSLALSPATIRNVMADLSDNGYLAQPHTSAGRVPTGKAFQDFAGAVPSGPLPAADQQRILHQMQSGENLEERVEIASRVLTEITQNVGIAAALPASAQELEHIELIALSGARVLMIVATRDLMVRQRVVTLDRDLKQDDLLQLRNYINANFAGWTLEKARAELLRRIEEERALYDAMLQQLTLLCQKGLLVVDQDPQLAMDGASYLMGLDLHLTSERMRALFRALEEKKHVVALLDRFLDSSQGQIGIHIGLADAHPLMGDLTLIGVTVDLPSGVRTRIAVLGPMRMNYEKVIPAVLQIGRTFEALQS